LAIFLPFIALAGALFLEFACIRPMWSFMLRFVSTPAQTFESALMGDARATSGFDANGEGLVAIEVDGRIVQCLGRLREEDRAQGIRVRAGDMLRVADVDAARQRCTVAYVGHAQITSS
jgi:translation initiation factor IF-1